jgi:hypothetical protein
VTSHIHHWIVTTAHLVQHWACACGAERDVPVRIGDKVPYKAKSVSLKNDPMPPSSGSYPLSEERWSRTR